MTPKRSYITTTLPYVNAEPHVGFASEIVLADVLARAARMRGDEVVFNTGTDEHGQKIYQKALEHGQDPQVYVDEYARHFEGLKGMLNLSYTHFIRTTNEHHMLAAQELWKRVNANGHIYKKYYKVKYCVGCELEKTDSELDHGFCPVHPGKLLESIEEENYFFRFSNFGEKLLDLYRNNPTFVIPRKRLNEITSFVQRGLEDFSISRLKAKMPWGIPVPSDEEHVMYVWFDALTNYISTLGWPEDEETFHAFWGDRENPNALQLAGKDNLRQQSAMWQAMLLAAGLPPSKQIGINGFITVDGQKMSKSIGNVISPKEMVNVFGVDGTRYLLLTKGGFGEDSDISWERMKEKYNADLANGLGNLVSRIVTLTTGTSLFPHAKHADTFNGMDALMQRMDAKEAVETIWEKVRVANKHMEETKPWEAKKKDPEHFSAIMQVFLDDMYVIAQELRVFLPETAECILKMISGGAKTILFPRL